MDNYRNEITFEIVERIGVLEKYPTGWSKEINLISWNGGPAKFDIREWDDSHEHMSRGITLTSREMKKVRELLDVRDAEKAGNLKIKKERDYER